MFRTEIEEAWIVAQVFPSASGPSERPPGRKGGSSVSVRYRGIRGRKFYWSDLPMATPLARLAELSHRRPSAERGYQDGKGFTGLDAYAARRGVSLPTALEVPSV